MQTEPEASLVCETPINADINSNTDGDTDVISSSPDHVALAPKKSAKKATRQWAAWTRQEEESFFSALRQVGKNFEKITCRVQSKNKDQVRHYYYRLVRRMNKLLGPGFCLDAKNSKDTIAAMLRWWSLLEKYSCKASKLHLKPRRFKIFIEALEHQLLKDRKKNIKKQPVGENRSPTVPSAVSNQSRATGIDAQSTKVILVQSQNVQKLGPGKASLLKRTVNMGVNRSNNKGDSSTGKTTRQRRKPAGPVLSAAYKRLELEKAAIDGVSLVAEAAAHVERTATDTEVERDQGQKGFNPTANLLPPLPLFLQNPFVESNAQSSIKLKLQLFPVDEATRRALEMDNHNPHLELTLSTRKKISSVLDHLNRKWGNSSVASGELTIFPYSAHRENLGNYQRWTQDSVISAADVYAMIGSPAVFRLRYGWMPMTDPGSASLQGPLATSCLPSEERVMNVISVKERAMDSIRVPAPPNDHHFKNLFDSCKDKLTSVTENTRVRSSTDVLNEIRHSSSHLNNSNPLISSASREGGDGTTVKQLEDSDGLKLSNATAMSAGEWADSLTNISIGELLLGVSDEIDTNCVNLPVSGSSQGLQPLPFTCDSFDAAIAAHISKHQDRTGFQSALASYSSSIWDAEETCDAFSFQKNPVIRQEVPHTSHITSPGACERIPRINLEDSARLVEELPEVECRTDNPAHENPMDECHSDLHTLDKASKDFSGLSDIYWPESLGPLDLDIPSSRYHNDLILSDSLSGLNRLIASSLDAFQNCSFFGAEKKETTATASVEARETASFSDFKIGSGV